MSQVFHEIEKKIISSLKDKPGQTLESLAGSTGLSADQTRRGVEWLRLKDLAVVTESETSTLSLGKNGLDAIKNGLPERQLLDLLIDGPKKLAFLQRQLGGVFGPAMGIAKRNNWVKTDSDTAMIGNAPSRLGAEEILGQIKAQMPGDQLDLSDLKLLQRRPDYIIQQTTKTKVISLAQAAGSIQLDSSNAIDVEAEAPRVFAARTHPLKDVIDEIREIFVTLGFSEISGNMAQSGFWNFDALFTPQDHPAREMQDTFYLDGVTSKKLATKQQISRVSCAHQKNWRYRWDISQAQKMVLRTHTTCVTIRHLADARPGEARVFSLGRVFRNEKPSYKHLVEFNQIEGVVVDKDATLRDLMGIQKEFYKRIGLEKIKFWPTFFPYTEPSLQTMVYNERLGKWVELFGMGIFRPEVTRPLGMTEPVLAWGGGIERIAMLKYGIDDVREFYRNDLKWLRGASRCQ